jgi:hypothetical protein
VRQGGQEVPLASYVFAQFFYVYTGEEAEASKGTGMDIDRLQDDLLLRRTFDPDKDAPVAPVGVRFIIKIVQPVREGGKSGD